MRRLYKALAQHSASSEENWEIIDRNSDIVIVPACRYCIDRTSSSLEEQYAACRCLEALCIMLGCNRDEHYEAVEGTLRRTVMSTDRVPQVRSAALRALCLTSFICCSGSAVDKESTSLLLDFCESLCREHWRGDEEILTPPKLRATALNCWALLSTLVDDTMISGEGDDVGRGLSMLPALLECLEHDYADLRFAAGECVALIHESRLSLGISNDVAENATERRYRHGKLYYQACLFIIW
jgi:Interferon-related developmental regulator (IFRD)